MTTTAQQLFILCGNDRRTLDTLIDEIERQLADQGATILLYGVTPKRREGFIVVEAARGIPPDVASRLKTRPDILECVVYNVPSIEQERQAEVQAAIQERAKPEQAALPASWYISKLPPPALPVGYHLLAKPFSLNPPSDERWTARVRSDEPGEGEGMLIYEEGKPLIFHSAMEALYLAVYLFAEGPALLAACPQLLELLGTTLRPITHNDDQEEQDRETR
jgi:hypothetical protein